MKKLLILGAVGVMAGAVFCADIISSAFAKEPPGTITSCHIGESYSAYLSGFSYDAKINGDKAYVKGRWQDSKGLVVKARNLPKDQFMQGLQKVVREKALYKWNGFNKSNKNVLDGTMWGLSISYSSKETISASGSNSFPSEYRTGRDALVNYFKTSLANAPVEVKDTYSLSEVKPYIIEALEYFKAKNIIKSSAPGEIYMCEAKGNKDLSRITIDTAVDPGHALQIIVSNGKVQAMMITAADGKNIEPSYAIINWKGKLENTNNYFYEEYKRGI